MNEIHPFIHFSNPSKHVLSPPNPVSIPVEIFRSLPNYAWCEMVCSLTNNNNNNNNTNNNNNNSYLSLKSKHKVQEIRIENPLFDTVVPCPVCIHS